MINSQQKMKLSNEYKVVKSSLVFEESESLRENEVTPGRDMEYLKNEIKDISLDSDRYNNNNHMEDIKKQMLNEPSD